MRFEITLVLFLISFVLLAVVHKIATMFTLYFVVPWFDIPMHFWGGTLVAMGSMTALFQRVFRIQPWNLVSALALVLLVGGIWEVWEWYADLAGTVPYLAPYIESRQILWILDTIKDLSMDLLGGAVGYYIAMRITRDFDTNM